MNNDKDDVNVQIICVTYNQINFIKDALDSFLMQKTNFKFQILVGDDCSSDGSSEIISQYALKYPKIINHIRRNKKLGYQANFMDLCENITAKYVAICDGNDYWTDENKLQIQFDYMEKNQDVNICAHFGNKLVNSNNSIHSIYSKQKKDFSVPYKLPLNKKLTIEDLAQEKPQVSSLFIRWKRMVFPSWAKTGSKDGDQSVIYLQIGNGFAYIMNKPMSVYREISSGVFSNNKTIDIFFEKLKTNLELLLALLKIIKTQIKNLLNLIKNTHRFLAYWLFALVPKKKNLWVFSGFKKDSYMDNSKYFFEYIIQNHPEIDAVWLTKSRAIINKLKNDQMPVQKMNSLIGIWTMARANLAFSDHFKMSDYDNRYGFNAKTKFVNLWHGVGPKGMVPIGDNLPNTTVPGVRLSTDIFIKTQDSFFTKILKTIKYPFLAPFRELFEQYYGIVCTGEPFLKYFAVPWRTPHKAHILSGYPRNTKIYSNKKTINENFEIIYAPTYRWHKEDEWYMINSFVENIKALNDLLEEIDAHFVLRLHPHTWRSYNNEILKSISSFPRFSISNEKDIYSKLSEYEMMITDYSSISYDFLITQKPIVYHAFDYDNYSITDCPFVMDYKSVCAGPITTNWSETIKEISHLYHNRNLYKDQREKVLEEFFPKTYNDIDNSLRIINILKEKIGLQEK
jgi:CDP-glycerol glycerophosphotransferase (TagB/SpsB family)